MFRHPLQDQMIVDWWSKKNYGRMDKPNPYGKPKHVLDFTNSPSQRKVFYAVVDFIREKITYPTIPDIAALTQMNDSAVNVAIESLARRGAVKITVDELAPKYLDEDVPTIRFRSRRLRRIRHPEEMIEVFQRRIKFTASKASARKRAKALKASGDHYAIDLEQMYKSQKGLCWWCGKPLPKNFHVDHRIPLSRGGTNDPGNLCGACPECNLEKSDQMPWEFCGRLL